MPPLYHQDEYVNTPARLPKPIENSAENDLAICAGRFSAH
jgi:hypothetical protein